MKKKHIIIGASAAGISAANKLRQLDAAADIICISDEIESPYNKCMLADYVAGIKSEEQVYTLTHEQAAQKNITLLLGKRVIALNPDKKNIVLDDGQCLSYDTLLLATGTSPIVPDIAGVDAQGVFTFHHLKDMQGIRSFILEHGVKKAVVVGSGLSGLECADALLHFGIQVTVVEMRDRVLSTLIDERGSRVIEARMADHGVLFYSNEMVEEVIHDDERVCVVSCASGKHIDADMVVFAVGVRPNLALAHQAGIACDAQGILTNEFMQTSVPDIYAAGDVAMVHDQLSGQLVPNRLWPDAMLQGLVAACHMVGQPRKYPGIASVISSSFFGIKFAVSGPILDVSLGKKLIKQTPDFYHAFLIADNRLKTFLLVGNTGNLGQFRKFLLTQDPLDSISNFYL